MTAVAKIRQHLGAEAIEEASPRLDTDIRRVRHEHQRNHRIRLHTGDAMIFDDLQSFEGERAFTRFITSEPLDRILEAVTPV